mgnify:CR=1 FL=1
MAQQDSVGRGLKCKNGPSSKSRIHQTEEGWVCLEILMLTKEGRKKGLTNFDHMISGLN